MTGRLLLCMASLLLLTPGCASSSGAEFAEVKVESNPPSAEVWIGDELSAHDTTPCTVLFDQEGDYEIYIKKAGYLTLKKRVRVVERSGEEGDHLEALPAEMIVTLDPIEGDDDGGGGGTQETPYYEDSQ